MFHLTLSPNISNVFEGFCILKRDEEIECLYSFPSDYSFQKFYEFIFPCDCPKDRSEEYCVVISNASNDRSFVMCKYFDIYQLYLCIYSLNPWFEIFSKLLSNLCQVDFMPDKYDSIGSYLGKILQQSTKECQVTLPPCHANDQTEQNILKCSLDFPNIYDKYIQEYLTAVNPNSDYNKQLWLEIFCSMLLERPIIFMSKRYQKLTASLIAATFFIHPLSWLHKFITIVPQKSFQLLGMNCCMLGIHSCMAPHLEKIDFWYEALLVDLDSGNSTMVGASENERETHYRFKVPKYIKKFFISHIQQVDDSLSSNVPHKIKDLIPNTPWNISKEETMYNDYKKGFHIYPLLFRTLISLIIGNYRQFISLNDGGYEFEKEKFIQYNSKLSDFLKIFVQSQCFDSFISEKLKCFQNSQEMNDRFDRERLEIPFKVKSSNIKNKERKLRELYATIFSKTSVTRSPVKNNIKVDRIEKMSTMPNPKKQKKFRAKHSLTIFHDNTKSLSSSTVSVNSNNNDQLSRDNLTDVSNNSDSFENQIMRDLTERGIILDGYRPGVLSTISSHTVADQDDILVTPTADRGSGFSNKLIECSLSKSEDMLSTKVKPPRQLFKPGEASSGRVSNIVDQINECRLDGRASKLIRSKPVSQIKQSDLPPNLRPVSQLTSLFEPNKNEKPNL